MDDTRLTATAIATRFGLDVHGDATVAVTGVATLATAGADDLAFLANPRYRSQLEQSRAGIVVLRRADAEGYAGTALIAPDPYVAYARIAALFEAKPGFVAGIHASAIVDPTAQVDPSVSIGAFTSIGARTRVAAGASIGAGCTIGEDCDIGEGCELVARVTLVRRVRLGRRVLVHPGAVLGADGFGIAFDRTPGSDPHWIKVPQLGGVTVGDDCEIGANTCIDRGALEDTVLEEDVRLDNHIQIAHNVRVGAHTAMAGGASVAGSTRIGRYCLIGGRAGIVGHIEICDRVTINAMSFVTQSIREPGEYSSGIPAAPVREWRKSVVRLRKLGTAARGSTPQEGE